MPEIIDRRIAFNAGEISPWLDPRIDLDKYRMGCRQMLNMRPSIYGGALRRVGTQYVGAAATASTAVRLIPFTFEINTNYMLEFSNLKIRIWSTGDTPALLVDGSAATIEITTPYLAAELNDLQVAQQNDVLFVTHPNHPPYCVARYAETHWDLRLLEQSWPATMGINITDTTITVTSDGTAPAPSGAAAWSSTTTYVRGNMVTNNGSVYTCKHKVIGIAPGTMKRWQNFWVWTTDVTGSSTEGVGRNVTLTASTGIFEAGHVGSKWVITHRRDNLKQFLHIPSTAAGGVSDPLYVLGEWSATLIADNNGTGDWSCNVIIQRSYDKVNWETHNVITGSKSAVQALLTGNEPAPIYLRLKLVSKTGTVPTMYTAEVEAGNPDHHGIVQISSVTSSTVAKGIVMFEVASTAATKRWEEPAWSDANGYPRAVTLHENRLWFGGTKAQPTTLWGSAVDGYGDFRIGAAADLAVAYTMQSDEASGIEWLVSREELLIGTTSSEWAFGTKRGDGTTPRLRRTTIFGSASVQARAVNDAVVFIQRSRRKLREYAWNSERDGYATNDLNMLSEHLGDARFMQMAVVRNPEAVVWVVTERGDLLAMTYERGQAVAGWSRHVTDGLFESVSTCPGAGEDDQLWVVVVRTVGGQTKRYIERFQMDTNRLIKGGERAALVFSDSAMIRTGAAATSIGGLVHLEGCTVSVLADGSPHPDCVVSGGNITLQWAASVVVVGLGYQSVLEPTYMETPDPASMSKAGKKRLHRAVVEFWQSLGVQISADGGTNYSNLEFRNVADLTDMAVPLFTGLKEEYVDGGTDRQASIIFMQTQPLPMNIMSIALRYNVEMS